MPLLGVRSSAPRTEPQLRLRVAIVDHHGASRAIAAALFRAGHNLVADPTGADVVLIDHDAPFHGRLEAVRACVAAGGRAFVYPHGAGPEAVASWDGLYPPSPLLSGMLVNGPGHAEIARRYGYPHPVHVIGWTFCALRPRVASGRVENVLFAPVHPPWADPRHAELLERLVATGANVTVRHIGSLEENLLPRLPGVRYVRGSLDDREAMLAQLDAADVVVAGRGTFMCLAIARGVATVTWESAYVPNNEQTREATHVELYREYMRYPFDLLHGDAAELLEAAANDVELACAWREKFIGGPLDVDALVAALAPPKEDAVSASTAVADRHRRGIALFESGRADEAADELRSALADQLDPELLNDFAVTLAATGARAEAAAVLRTCLAIDASREDARENLAALDAEDDAAWRSSPTLGGPDPHMPERAFPGMPAAAVMSEHAMRYAFATNFVGGKRVLDLGCGTGYGSEMLTWVAASVEGFDLWQPAPHEVPRWPGGAKLTYGHDLCRDPLPAADAATMFEVIEHLDDAPAALRRAWQAVGLIVASFPNPVYHGSHHNPYHVNDWSLDELERQLREAAGVRFRNVAIAHLQQVEHGIIVPGRNPNASYWIVVAQGLDPIA
jgi:2-polyprenyl-3-methyl-5-hydroxy-6-metoxy-1,4-benzoquinol methylase